MADDPLRLIIHAADAASLTRARSNAMNLLAAEPEAQIEIVVNGPAVAAALDRPHESDRFLLLCENTLRGNDRVADPDYYRRVPAAVVHIARRQQQGWSYMRA